jgi:signal peptidase II
MIALVVLGVDQWSKWLIVHKMKLYESIPVIDGFFYITSHRNRGAAFGILQNQQWLFILVTLIVVVALIYYLWKYSRESALLSWSFALVLGGAIGNLLDRVRLGEVVDFFHFIFGTYHYPIFNVADSAIVIGVGLLLLATFLQEKRDQARPEAQTEEAGWK